MVLSNALKFQWDEGNIDKNRIEHGVSCEEIEAIFFDDRCKTFRDRLHSGKEERYRIIGKTGAGRLLFVVFTVRQQEVRVISARDVNRKEVPLYEKTA